MFLLPFLVATAVAAPAPPDVKDNSAATYLRVLEADTPIIKDFSEKKIKVDEKDAANILKVIKVATPLLSALAEKNKKVDEMFVKDLLKGIQFLIPIVEGRTESVTREVEDGFWDFIVGVAKVAEDAVKTVEVVGEVVGEAVKTAAVDTYEFVKEHGEEILEDAVDIIEGGENAGLLRRDINE